MRSKRQDHFPATFSNVLRKDMQNNYIPASMNGEGMTQATGLLSLPADRTKRDVKLARNGE